MPRFLWLWALLLPVVAHADSLSELQRRAVASGLQRFERFTRDFHARPPETPGHIHGLVERDFAELELSDRRYLERRLQLYGLPFTRFAGSTLEIYFDLRTPPARRVKIDFAEMGQGRLRVAGRLFEGKLHATLEKTIEQEILPKWKRARGGTITKVWELILPSAHALASCSAESGQRGLNAGIAVGGLIGYAGPQALLGAGVKTCVAVFHGGKEFCESGDAAKALKAGARKLPLVDEVCTLKDCASH